MNRIYTGAMPAAMAGGVETKGWKWPLKMDGNDKPIMGRWI